MYTLKYEWMVGWWFSYRNMRVDEYEQWQLSGEKSRHLEKRAGK